MIALPDAVVIGAGHNGLVAANLLVDHGWSVMVLESSPSPGGGMRSGELMEPGYVNDTCSAFFPLAAVSPHLARLDLERWGLRWRRAPLVVAHPATDGTCPAISQDGAETHQGLEAIATGDGDAWQELYELWQRVRPSITEALLCPFPPVRSGLAMAMRGRHDLGDLLRLLALPVQRLGVERFTSVGARRLVAGLALHADLMPEAVLSGMFGWLMAGLAQEVGFPVAEGGAGSITTALVRRLQARGGSITCNAPVSGIEVRRGRAIAVRTEHGPVAARHGVLADVDAVQLYTELVDASALPSSTLRHISRFDWDHATFKVDWNLNGPIPWASPIASTAGTVHIAEDVDELTMSSAQMSTGHVPEKPFLVMGQLHVADPTRQPEGSGTAFAYTHLPRQVRGDAGIDGISGDWANGDDERLADRMEARIEELAPGFRSRIRTRHLLTPTRFTVEERNMPLGALNLGTSQLHQQALLRPIPGLGRSETPVKGLFLASASAHPGGGVHGACGANAARAAMVARRFGSPVAAALSRRC